jgi:osmotically-inducible protein OsmY
MQHRLAIGIRAGQHVFCKDGYLGRVELLFLNPSGKIKGFVLRTGDWIHHDFIVPVDWVQKVDQENVHLSVKKQALKQLDEYVTDAVLAGEIDHAIWENNALWRTQFSEIDTTVQDGIVTLRGYVPKVTDKLLVENAVKIVAGVLGVENRLIADYDLTIQVAQALGRDERTRLAMVSVNVQNGVVSLSGHVEKTSTLYAAEEIAASVPNVRGVMNAIQAPGVHVDPAENRFLQPPIGAKVYAADIQLGTVDKVIIQPHNRRVTAFVVHGFFPDPKINDLSQSLSEDTFQERRVVLPSRLVRFETDSSVYLDINGMEAAEYSDFNDAQYCPPPDGWQPPYPYRNQEILFEGPTKRLIDDLHSLADLVVDIKQKVSAAEKESKDKVEVSIKESLVEAIARQQIFEAQVVRRQADRAEAYAETAIGIAMLAIDEVEIATLEAIETENDVKTAAEPM